MDFKVYKATSPSGKHYIGLTSKNLEERKYYHHYRASKGRKLPFSEAIRKYGIDNFTWNILGVCENLEDAVNLEKSYIKEYNSFNSGYNATPGGIAPSYYTGRKRKEETKSKISRSLMGHPGFFKGKKLNKEHRLKIAKTKGSPFYSVNKTTNEKQVWYSLTECMESLGLSSKGTLWACIEGRKKSYKGYLFGRCDGY